jgi:hypothetical protein
MLDCSEEDVVYENISYKAHAGTISGKTMFKEGITKMSPTLASMLTEAVADMVAPVFEAAPVPSKPVEVDISQFKLGDPAPECYIWLGKKLTRIGWPS